MLELIEKLNFHQQIQLHLSIWTEKLYLELHLPENDFTEVESI